jgi:TorA maturation chaperone TorD
MPATAQRVDLVRTLATLVEEPRDEHRPLAELLELPAAPEPGEYTDLFLMNLYPYASVHLGAEGMLGGEARDRVAGFWRALGITPPAEPDHLGALLGLLAAIMEREVGETDPARSTLLARAREALVWEHLLPWVPAFTARVRELGGEYYARWAGLLEDVLRDEAPPATSQPDSLPVHLAEAPDLPDPRTAADAAGESFLLALLAPVRSGMILTRRDLSRAGRHLGLGVRKGERLFILKSFLAQDATATLEWLANEATDWTRRHRAIPGWDGSIESFWEGRAEAAVRLLGELAATSEGETDHD